MLRLICSIARADTDDGKNIHFIMRNTLSDAYLMRISTYISWVDRDARKPANKTIVDCLDAQASTISRINITGEHDDSATLIQNSLPYIMSYILFLVLNI
jgi:hypothetical protein